MLGNLFSSHPTGDMNKGIMPRALATARTQGRQPLTSQFYSVLKAVCVPAPVCVRAY